MPRFKNFEFKDIDKALKEIGFPADTKLVESPCIAGSPNKRIFVCSGDFALINMENESHSVFFVKKPEFLPKVPAEVAKEQSWRDWRKYPISLEERVERSIGFHHVCFFGISKWAEALESVGFPSGINLDTNGSVPTEESPDTKDGYIESLPYGITLLENLCSYRGALVLAHKLSLGVVKHPTGDRLTRPCRPVCWRDILVIEKGIFSSADKAKALEAVDIPPGMPFVSEWKGLPVEPQFFPTMAHPDKAGGVLLSLPFGIVLAGNVHNRSCVLILKRELSPTAAIEPIERMPGRTF